MSETNTANLEKYSENELLQLIVFKMGSEEYAIPISCVQEIILKQETTKMPQTPSFVEGIINLRGKIIPIIDGKKKFGLADDSSEGSEDKIMVIDLAQDIIGLVVDEVYEVVHVPVSQIDKPPVEVNTENNFLMGVAKFEGRLIILLDPQEVLSVNETTALKGLSELAKMA